MRRVKVEGKDFIHHILVENEAITPVLSTKALKVYGVREDEGGAKKLHVYPTCQVRTYSVSYVDEQ